MLNNIRKKITQYTNTEHSLQVTQNHTSIILILGLGLFALLAIGITYSKVFAFETATEYKFVKKWGEEGKGGGQFQRPHDLDFSPDEKILYVVDRDGVEIDSKGNFLVNERGNERMQKFDSNWNPILIWGSKGSGDEQFCHMEHIAVDKYDNIYVTDPQSGPGCSQQPRVLKFVSQGHFVTKWGSYGNSEGQFRWKCLCF